MLFKSTYTLSLVKIIKQVFCLVDFTPVNNFFFFFCYFPTNTEGVLLRKPLCQLLKLTHIPPGMQKNKSTLSQGSNEAPT